MTTFVPTLMTMRRAWATRSRSAKLVSVFAIRLILGLALKQSRQVLVNCRNGTQAGKLLPVAVYVGIDLRLAAKLRRLPAAQVNEAVGAIAVAIEPVTAVALGLHHRIELPQHAQ